jgi:hypothetical protein
VDRTDTGGHRPSAGQLAAGNSAPGQPFSVLVAVHRPRYRGRAERAASLIGWRVQSLMNKEDPVGQIAKSPRPPDILIMSEDFGRQKEGGIFRAVQQWRAQGMQIVCMLDEEAHADAAGVPEELCDLVLGPPYTCATLRAALMGVYERLRGQPAPPPVRLAAQAAVSLDDSD